MPKIRLFKLLIKLRCDQLEREGAWQEAVQARAKVIAEREKKGLTIEEAYQSFKDRAEAQLKREDAPEWRRLAGDRFLDNGVWRFRTTPWLFIWEKLQAERGMPFTEVELFEAVRLVQLEEGEKVDLAIRQFIAQQDDSGYTDELLAGLWAWFPADCKARGIERPNETQFGGGQGGETRKGPGGRFVAWLRRDVAGKVVASLMVAGLLGLIAFAWSWIQE